MRKMKKISALLLAVCMGTGLLAGCSSGDTKKADTEKQRNHKKSINLKKCLFFKVTHEFLEASRREKSD